MHGFGIHVVNHYINPANVDETGFEPATTALQTAALPLELFVQIGEHRAQLSITLQGTSSLSLRMKKDSNFQPLA